MWRKVGQFMGDRRSWNTQSKNEEATHGKSSMKAAVKLASGSREAFSKVLGNYTSSNVRLLSLQLYNYLNETREKVKRTHRFLKLANQKFLFVHFFACRVAQESNQYPLDFYMKESLVAYILLELNIINEPEFSGDFDHQTALKERVARLLWTIYSKYMYYLTGRSNRVEVYAIICKFLQAELPPKIPDFFRDFIQKMKSYVADSTIELPYLSAPLDIKVEPASTSQSMFCADADTPTAIWERFKEMQKRADDHQLQQDQAECIEIEDDDDVEEICAAPFQVHKDDIKRERVPDLRVPSVQPSEEQETQHETRGLVDKGRAVLMEFQKLFGSEGVSMSINSEGKLVVATTLSLDQESRPRANSVRSNPVSSDGAPAWTSSHTYPPSCDSRAAPLRQLLPNFSPHRPYFEVSNNRPENHHPALQEFSLGRNLAHFDIKPIEAVPPNRHEQMQGAVSNLPFKHHSPDSGAHLVGTEGRFEGPIDLSRHVEHVSIEEPPKQLDAGLDLVKNTGCRAVEDSSVNPPPVGEDELLRAEPIEKPKTASLNILSVVVMKKDQRLEHPLVRRDFELCIVEDEKSGRISVEQQCIQVSDPLSVSNVGESDREVMQTDTDKAICNLGCAAVIVPAQTAELSVNPVLVLDEHHHSDTPKPLLKSAEVLDSSGEALSQGYNVIEDLARQQIVENPAVVLLSVATAPLSEPQCNPGHGATVPIPDIYPVELVKLAGIAAAQPYQDCGAQDASDKRGVSESASSDSDKLYIDVSEHTDPGRNRSVVKRTKTKAELKQKLAFIGDETDVDDLPLTYRFKTEPENPRNGRRSNSQNSASGKSPSARISGTKPRKSKKSAATDVPATDEGELTYTSKLRSRSLRASKEEDVAPVLGEVPVVEKKLEEKTGRPRGRPRKKSTTNKTLTEEGKKPPLVPFGAQVEEENKQFQLNKLLSRLKENCKNDGVGVLEPKLRSVQSKKRRQVKRASFGHVTAETPTSAGLNREPGMLSLPTSAEVALVLATNTEPHEEAGKKGTMVPSRLCVASQAEPQPHVAPAHQTENYSANSGHSSPLIPLDKAVIESIGRMSTLIETKPEHLEHARSEGKCEVNGESSSADSLCSKRSTNAKEPESASTECVLDKTEVQEEKIVLSTQEVKSNEQDSDVTHNAHSEDSTLSSTVETDKSKNSTQPTPGKLGEETVLLNFASEYEIEAMDIANEDELLETSDEEEDGSADSGLRKAAASELTQKSVQSDCCEVTPAEPKQVEDSATAPVDTSLQFCGDSDVGVHVSSIVPGETPAQIVEQQMAIGSEEPTKTMLVEEIAVKVPDWNEICNRINDLGASEENPSFVEPKPVVNGFEDGTSVVTEPVSLQNPSKAPLEQQSQQESDLMHFESKKIDNDVCAAIADNQETVKASENFQSTSVDVVQEVVDSVVAVCEKGPTEDTLSACEEHQSTSEDVPEELKQVEVDPIEAEKSGVVEELKEMVVSEKCQQQNRSEEVTGDLKQMEVTEGAMLVGKKNHIEDTVSGVEELGGQAKAEEAAEQLSAESLSVFDKEVQIEDTVQAFVECEKQEKVKEATKELKEMDVAASEESQQEKRSKQVSGDLKEMEVNAGVTEGPMSVDKEEDRIEDTVSGVEELGGQAKAEETAEQLYSESLSVFDKEVQIEDTVQAFVECEKQEKVKEATEELKEMVVAVSEVTGDLKELEVNAGVTEGPMSVDKEEDCIEDTVRDPEELRGQAKRELREMETVSAESVSVFYKEAQIADTVQAFEEGEQHEKGQEVTSGELKEMVVDPLDAPVDGLSSVDKEVHIEGTMEAFEGQSKDEKGAEKVNEVAEKKDHIEERLRDTEKESKSEAVADKLKLIEVRADGGSRAAVLVGSDAEVQIEVPKLSAADEKSEEVDASISNVPSEECEAKSEAPPRSVTVSKDILFIDNEAFDVEFIDHTEDNQPRQGVSKAPLLAFRKEEEGKAVFACSGVSKGVAEELELTDTVAAVPNSLAPLISDKVQFCGSSSLPKEISPGVEPIGANRLVEEVPADESLWERNFVNVPALANDFDPEMKCPVETTVEDTKSVEVSGVDPLGCCPVPAKCTEEVKVTSTEQSRTKRGVETIVNGSEGRNRNFSDQKPSPLTTKQPVKETRERRKAEKRKSPSGALDGSKKAKLDGGAVSPKGKKGQERQQVGKEAVRSQATGLSLKTSDEPNNRSPSSPCRQRSKPITPEGGEMPKGIMEPQKIRPTLAKSRPRDGKVKQDLFFVDDIPIDKSKVDKYIKHLGAKSPSVIESKTSKERAAPVAEKTFRTTPKGTRKDKILSFIGDLTAANSRKLEASGGFEILEDPITNYAPVPNAPINSSASSNCLDASILESLAQDIKVEVPKPKERVPKTKQAKAVHSLKAALQRPKAVIQEVSNKESDNTELSTFLTRKSGRQPVKAPVKRYLGPSVPTPVQSTSAPTPVQPSPVGKIPGAKPRKLFLEEISSVAKPPKEDSASRKAPKVKPKGVKSVSLKGGEAKKVCLTATSLSKPGRGDPEVEKESILEVREQPNKLDEQPKDCFEFLQYPLEVPPDDNLPIQTSFSCSAPRLESFTDPRWNKEPERLESVQNSLMSGEVPKECSQLSGWAIEQSVTDCNTSFSNAHPYFNSIDQYDSWISGTSNMDTVDISLGSIVNSLPIITGPDVSANNLEEWTSLDVLTFLNNSSMGDLLAPGMEAESQLSPGCDEAPSRPSSVLSSRGKTDSTEAQDEHERAPPPEPPLPTQAPPTKRRRRTPDEGATKVPNGKSRPRTRRNGVQTKSQNNEPTKGFPKVKRECSRQAARELKAVLKLSEVETRMKPDDEMPIEADDEMPIEADDEIPIEADDEMRRKADDAFERAKKLKTNPFFKPQSRSLTVELERRLPEVSNGKKGHVYAPIVTPWDFKRERNNCQSDDLADSYSDFPYD